MQLKLYLIISLLFMSTQSGWAQVYKYQDDQGKWHFSDKKPAKSDLKIEELKFEEKISKTLKPHLKLQRGSGKTNFIIDNPYFAPIQIFLNIENDRIEKNISENTQEIVYTKQTSAKPTNYKFRYVLGSPNSRHSQKKYHPPFKDFKPMRVTQGFKGRFSHYAQPSLYAIDLGMKVGTKITAARAGKVIYTKDDYSSSGVSSPFFVDKANVVKVLHEDGTYAVYAHLLLGSVKVKAGEQVEAGDTLALSGNTGYSTGPHLHFVIRKNEGGRSKSLPFKLFQNKEVITPKTGMWLLPAKKE